MRDYSALPPPSLDFLASSVLYILLPVPRQLNPILPVRYLQSDRPTCSLGSFSSGRKTFPEHPSLQCLTTLLMEAKIKIILA